jgi:sugar phosphate isomerase/epimerase
VRFQLGIKSDPIEFRYSFDWLFSLMEELDVRYVQVGSFPELYWVEDEWLLELRERAARRGVSIRSCYTSHRDLGGFFSGEPALERAARRAYERCIHVASVLGAHSMGANPGSVFRDRMETKPAGIAIYLRHMKELMAIARKAGLRALHPESMSCLAEPPSLPEEVEAMLGELAEHHAANPHTTVPVRLCSDIGHGYADAEKRVVCDNWARFEHEIPWMGEFHVKNTDAIFDATFGFSAAERQRGIVDLARFRELLERNRERFPVEEIVGYLELGGPKLGRDYSDHRLGDMIRESIRAVQACFPH